MRSGKRYELNNCYNLEACGFNLFKIQAYLEGNTPKDSGILVNLLLDTGASLTVIKSKIIHNLGYDLNQPLKIQKIGGLAGKEVLISTIKINSFSCVGKKINNFEIQVCDQLLPKQLQSLDGVLGMDFLKAAETIISIADSIIACVNHE